MSPECDDILRRGKEPLEMFQREFAVTLISINQVPFIFYVGPYWNVKVGSIKFKMFNSEFLLLTEVLVIKSM